MMRHTRARRLVAGLFSLLFAASGLTREFVGACPQHSAAPVEAAESDARLTPQPSAAAAHQHHASHQHDAAPPSQHNTPERGDHGAHCDCIGDCCGCALVRLGSAPAVLIAVHTPVATPVAELPASEQPAAHVDLALPFATAPPATHAT
jgi:hypothetical protein